MNATKLKIFSIVLLFIFIFPLKAFSKDDNDLYYQGVKAAGRGEADFAFVYFFEVLRNFPESEFFDDALFAVGEHYFLIADYYDARKAFRQFIEDYPASQTKIFAFVYLLKIAEKQGNKETAEYFKKEIIGLKQVSLLFRDFIEYKYLSPFYKDYKAKYFIDRIEIYINEELFEKIPF